MSNSHSLQLSLQKLFLVCILAVSSSLTYQETAACPLNEAEEETFDAIRRFQYSEFEMKLMGDTSNLAVEENEELRWLATFLFTNAACVISLAEACPCGGALLPERGIAQTIIKNSVFLSGVYNNCKDLVNKRLPVEFVINANLKAYAKTVGEIRRKNQLRAEQLRDALRLPVVKASPLFVPSPDICAPSPSRPLGKGQVSPGLTPSATRRNPSPCSIGYASSTDDESPECATAFKRYSRTSTPSQTE